MSTRQEGEPSAVIESRDDLVAWIAAGETPPASWRIGTEHEKFIFHRETRAPVAFEEGEGIQALMKGLMACCGWQPIIEGGNIIALKRAPGEPGATVSLEPGGQFELSGAPLETLHQTAAELAEHLRQCHEAGEALGLSMIGLGFSPKWRIDETPKMPKKRYEVMTKYMPKVGTRGLDMMYRTATIQVNLDFSSEADMVRKMRVGLALQPIATALFASSPFVDGKLSGFKSLRSEVWRHTDGNRTGMLPFVYEESMGYEAYVDYALRVPMYFVYRDGNYIDCAGASFQDFMDGRLPGFENEKPTLDDWSDHLTTLFPEVRLKRFLEMRGADAGRFEMICAVPAFWVGLMYDSEALDGAYEIISNWREEERQQLRDNVPELGLQTPFRGETVRDIAVRVIGLAKDGLARRNKKSPLGREEGRFLAPLEDISERGYSVADQLISDFQGPWGGQIDPVFEAARL